MPVTSSMSKDNAGSGGKRTDCLRFVHRRKIEIFLSAWVGNKPLEFPSVDRLAQKRRQLHPASISHRLKYSLLVAAVASLARQRC